MRVRFPPSGTRKTEIVLSFCLSKLLATTDFYDRILLLLLDMEGTMFTDLLTVRRLILMVMLSVATMVVGHHLRSAAQNSQALYEVMLAADVADFLMTGGEPIAIRTTISGNMPLGETLQREPGWNERSSGMWGSCMTPLVHRRSISIYPSTNRK